MSLYSQPPTSATPATGFRPMPNYSYGAPVATGAMPMVTMAMPPAGYVAVANPSVPGGVMFVPATMLAAVAAAAPPVGANPGFRPQ
jgi:hypothetical protein